MLKKYQWLIIILCLAVLARIPTLFEPYWYGDEAIYLTIGQALKAGVPLYSGIHDNKPPFLYLAATLAGGNQFWFKFIALVWVLATIVVFYKLAEKVFEKQRGVYLATGIFAFLINWPKLEGNIANAELFFLLPTLMAVLWLWTKPATGAIRTAGIFLGLGALFKMPAMLEAGVWPLIWFFDRDGKWMIKTLVLAGGVAIPIGISIVYFGFAGSLGGYLTAAWAQNLPYLSSWTAPGGETGVYSLTGRLIIAGGLLISVFLFSQKQERRLRIVGIWAIFSLFASLLSGRPYPHYLIQAAGVLSICGALIFTGGDREKKLGISVVVVFLAVTQLFRFYNYQVLGYYKNFGEWVLGVKSREDYFGWFNRQVNNNYEIARIIKAGSNREDKIFVWGDEPMIYVLSKRNPVGKYTVRYHVRDFNAGQETLISLLSDPPKYVVRFDDGDDLPGLDGLLFADYLEQARVEQAIIYRLAIYN